MARNLDDAVKLIKSFEGIEDGDPSTTSLDPYLCPGRYWTIGWGHAVIGPNGTLLKGPEQHAVARSVYPHGLTMEEAKVLLADDVRRFSAGIESAIHVPLSDGRFCALVSFAFNVGLGAFRESTLLRLLNEGRAEEAPAQLMRWTKSNGQVFEGLRRRREAEVALWRQSA